MQQPIRILYLNEIQRLLAYSQVEIVARYLELATGVVLEPPSPFMKNQG
jgi:hypothetical protein